MRYAATTAQSRARIRRSTPAGRRAPRAPPPTPRTRGRSGRSCRRCRRLRTLLRATRVEPAAAAALLRLGGRRVHLETPGARRFGAERQLEPAQLLAAGHQQHHLVAGAVLLEAVVETIGAHAVVVDREDL